MQEDKLVQVLKEMKRTIGWSIHDIVGVSLTRYTNRIKLENAKPVRDFQRRLNLVMQEVVKKEGIIYPLGNNSWVSPVHVVPKNSGFTMQKNESTTL